MYCEINNESKLKRIEKAKVKYDFVIIGSGLGGLQCAYTLTKEGFSVCVLEKNRQIGGNLQIFVRDKAIFDTGIHYIGGLDKGQNLHTYFTYFGLMEKLKLKKLDVDGFDVVSFDSDPNEYKFAQGYENYKSKLLSQFPNEEAALTAYCTKLKEISNHFPLYNVKTGPSSVLETKFLEINTHDYIASITTNRKLQNVLAGTNALYAGVAEKTPLYVHALVINTYIESAWKCIDGGAQIGTILAKSIKEHGGVVRNYAEVVKFNFSGDNIHSAELKSGETIEAKNFISNVHPSNTLNMLEPGKIRKSYVNRVQSLENSMSVFIVQIVFKEKSFPYLNHNYYHHKAEDSWASIHYSEKNWPESYAVFTPPSSHSPEYAESMSVMAYMKYDEVKKWENTFNTIPKNISDRGADYADFKAEKAEKLLTELEKKFPGIRSKIRSISTSTPLSYRDYIGTNDGSMYGILKDHKDPLRTFISAKTKVPNLLLTGQNLNMHGVLGVTIGSVVTCAEVLGMEYLVKKIQSA